MARETFVWNPDLGASRSVKPNVLVSKFGDGYEQRVKLGINTMPATWDVTFTRNIVEMVPINTFLGLRGGSESFYWISPSNQTLTPDVYVCREWTYSQQEFGLYVIQCRFEQVFEA